MNPLQIKPEDAANGRLPQLIARAASEGRPLALSAGIYPVSDLDLPDGTHLVGVPGATNLAYSGGRFFLRATGKRRITLSNLTLDGRGANFSAEAPALFVGRSVERLLIENCEIINSSVNGLHLERCSAEISGNRISTAAEYALYAVEGTSSVIRDNRVEDCGNGGILVHRWTKGFDGTIISGNRLTNIRATRGGTGPYGNAINTYRADNVMIANNHIRGAAFSAIRANASSDVQIAGNQCIASGETAIYSEFGFEGAIVSGNLVDGAANGISVVNFDSGGRLAVISGNIVRNISDTGPYVHDSVGFGFGIAVEADASVTGNVIESVARAGLLLGWGPYLRNLSVTGNVVRQAKTGCMVSVADGAGRAVIANNLFEATPSGAVIGYRWHDAATSELAKGSTAYPHLTISGNSIG